MNQAKRKKFSWREWLDKFGPLIGLVFVFVIFAVARPSTFLTWSNIEVMLLQTAVVGTAALGMTVVIIAGGIDLSVGSNIALCTVAVAQLLNLGMPPLLAAVGGIAVGSASGLLIGELITRLRLTPFIVTLGMLGALRGLAKGLAGEQMVLAPSSGLNDLLTTIGSESWAVLPPGVWIMLALSFLTAVVLRMTRFGRHVYTIGSNEATARLCGIKVERTKVTIYVIGAGLAGVAGVLQFSYLTMGDPTTALGLELDVIAAVVIGGGSLHGGQGSVPGSIIGALIMTVVGNGCTKLGLDNWVQEIVTGTIIILAVVLDQLRQRRS